MGIRNSGDEAKGNNNDDRESLINRDGQLVLFGKILPAVQLTEE